MCDRCNKLVESKKFYSAELNCSTRICHNCIQVSINSFKAYEQIKIDGMSELSTTELSDISSPKSHLTSTMGISNSSCNDNTIMLDHDESSTTTRQTQLSTRPATSSNITGDTTYAEDTLSRSDTLSIICSFSPHRNFLHELYTRESAENTSVSFKLANGKHIDTTMVRNSIRY